MSEGLYGYCLCGRSCYERGGKCFACKNPNEPAPRSVDVARACLESIVESAADGDNIQAIKDEARHGLRLLDAERREPPAPVVDVAALRALVALVRGHLRGDVLCGGAALEMACNIADAVLAGHSTTEQTGGAR